MTSAARSGGGGGLGRGLAALIPTRSSELSATEIPLSRIQRSRHQPRHRFDEQELASLAASIAEHGVLQPVLVSETLDGYELIAGERRVRAAERAGLRSVPAVVRQVADRERLELALVENIQRSDLNPLEEAEAYRELAQTFGLAQEEIARRVGRSRPTIANSLRLLTLPDSVRASLSDGLLSEGHARAIAGLESSNQQEQLAGVVVARGLSVRQTEELARRLKRGFAEPEVSGREIRADPDSERLEADLRSALGTKVSLQSARKGGRIVIEYYDSDELNRLCDRLLGAGA